MPSIYRCIHLLCMLCPSLISALPRRTTTNINANFEDPSLSQGTVFTDLYGLHFDGFVALAETPGAIGQLILFDGQKAAIPAPGGNEIRTDLSTSKYSGLDVQVQWSRRPSTVVSTSKYSCLDLQSVDVGYFLQKKLSATVNNLPLSSLSLGQLAAALQSLTGAGSTAEKCKIRVRVLGMQDTSKFNALKQAGHDYVDYQFTPTLNVAGQGVGEVQTCPLTGLGWSGVTRFNVTVQEVETILPGAGGGIGNTAPVIDDLMALGHLK